MPRDALTLTKEQRAEMLASLRRFFSDKLELELSEMRSGFLLDYVLKELAPVAYNQGVEDARRHLTAAAEDLPGSCFLEPMTFWKASAQATRRKPGG